MNVIEIENLCKQFKGKKGSVVRAVDNLSLTVKKGEVIGFLGPNGAGKSTTIKTLMGLITPTSGSARICGIPVSECYARSTVGFLPENPSFYDFLTASEYLRYVGTIFGMEESSLRRESERVLDLLELSSASNRPIRGYSKGMVQRLGLAQALLHDPDVYILDEPMSGLDPLGRSLVKSVIKDLGKCGKTVFFSTHITADVEVVCDRVAIIVSGRLGAVHSVDTILEAGIEGYTVRVRNCPEISGEGIEIIEAGSPVYEFYVSRNALDRFVAQLSSVSATIELIEPRRKDLEGFFLDIVSRGSDAM